MEFATEDSLLSVDIDLLAENQFQEVDRQRLKCAAVARNGFPVGTRCVVGMLGPPEGGRNALMQSFASGLAGSMRCPRQDPAPLHQGIDDDGQTLEYVTNSGCSDEQFARLNAVFRRYTGNMRFEGDQAAISSQVNGAAHWLQAIGADVAMIVIDAPSLDSLERARDVQCHRVDPGIASYFPNILNSNRVNSIRRFLVQNCIINLNQIYPCMNLVERPPGRALEATHLILHILYLAIGNGRQQATRHFPDPEDPVEVWEELPEEAPEEAEEGEPQQEVLILSDSEDAFGDPSTEDLQDSIKSFNIFARNP